MVWHRHQRVVRVNFIAVAGASCVKTSDRRDYHAEFGPCKIAPV